MRRIAVAFVTTLLLAPAVVYAAPAPAPRAGAAQAIQPYFPDRLSWEHKANWFLNTGKRTLPSAPETAVGFSGNGQNVICVDWENDVVAVIRWIRGGGAVNEVVGGILASIDAPPRQAAR